MTEAQIKELTDKLTALEQQLQNQSGATASATVSSSTTPGPITVKVPRERKLRKFAGGRDDGMLEEWIGDATGPSLDKQTLMPWTFCSTTWTV